MRELRLVLGSTTAATSAVLAIFMAGLGIGSAVLGPVAERSPRPLRLYGMFEVGISLTAALTPWLVALVSWVYVGLGGQMALGPIGATVVRLLLSTVVLIVPAFLMGGTLPAMAKAVTSSSDARRRSLGILYGTNTLGAVAGSAGATFLALEQLGTRATLWSGCALGLIAGSLAIRLARDLAPLSADDTHDSTTADEGSSNFFHRLAYATAAILGFAFFAMEIVWFRMLAPLLGGTTFTFGLILCVALAGIGLGGLAYNIVFSRIRPSWIALSLTCGLESLFLLFPYALGDRLAVLAVWYARSATGFGSLTIGWTVVSTIVVGLAAIVSGVQFPLLIALLGQGRAAVGKHVGVAYAWNTFGAILGSLVAGFGALPLLGAEGMWLALGGLMAVLSVFLLITAAGANWPGRVAVVVTVALAVASMFATGPTAAWRHSGIGAGRTFLAEFEPNAIEYWRNVFREGVVWQADGLEAGVAIKMLTGYDFVVNGKTDGNSLNDAPTQVGVAMLGAVLHPDPRTALVIGLGTGESAGWLAEMRNIEHVDVVEIEPALDEMVRRCSDVNFDALHHPEVRRIYNDGREYVLTADDRYDVIVSEPSNPYRAGVATLYTSEFYAAARERLNSGGVFIQFMQAYEVDDATIETVLCTVRSAFRHVEVWQTLAADLQLVCSDTPIRYSADELRTRLANPVVETALRDVWRTPGVEGFLAHFVASSEWVDQVAQMQRVPLNTDDRTILEYKYAKTVGKLTPFSVEQLRSNVAAQGWQRPRLEDGSVDWRKVELRRQAFNTVFNGPFSVALLTDPADIQLVKAFMAYREDRFDQVLQNWPAEHIDIDIDLARLLLARSLAETANPICLEVLEGLGDPEAADATAVRVIYYLRRNDVEACEREFKHFVEQLRNAPWTLKAISETAFSRAIDVAKADSEAAKRVYPLFVEPYAGRQFDYVRRLGRWMIAKEIGPEAVADALAPLEPYIPWTAELLQSRADAYRQTGNPLQDQAEADWARFQRNP